ARAEIYTTLNDVCKKGAGLARPPGPILPVAEARIGIGELPKLDGGFSDCKEIVAHLDDSVKEFNGTEPRSVYTCLCYAIYLRDFSGASADKKTHYAKIVTGLYTLIPTEAPAPAPPCTVSVSPDHVDVPSSGTTVTVTVTTNAGEDVEVEATRADSKDGLLKRSGKADAMGKFVATYVYDVKADETFPSSQRIVFTVNQPACGTTGSTKYTRPAPSGGFLVAQGNPLGVNKDEQFKVILHVTAVGTIHWTLQSNG